MRWPSHSSCTRWSRFLYERFTNSLLPITPYHTIFLVRDLNVMISNELYIIKMNRQIPIQLVWLCSPPLEFYSSLADWLKDPMRHLPALFRVTLSLQVKIKWYFGINSNTKVIVHHAFLFIQVSVNICENLQPRKVQKCRKINQISCWIGYTYKSTSS